VGIVQARYDPILSTTAWRTRIRTAMTYYSRRPGKDREREEREARERGHPQVKGRWFITDDGQKLPLREAEERFRREVEARQAAAEARKAARERELTERYGRRIRLPLPAHRFYQVVLSTKWAALHDRDVAEILGRAFGGLAAATAGAAGDAYQAASRAAERDARRYEARRERQLARELGYERERAEREQRARDRRHERDNARWAVQYAHGPTWMYVRHANTANPHVHVVAVTDGRGLDVADLNRMRAHVLEREQHREREQERERPRGQGRGYGLGD